MTKNLKDRAYAAYELLGACGVFFIIICLQVWYILTGNE
jgi:hypothetical protein